MGCSSASGVHLDINTWKMFLCFVAIVRVRGWVRVYYVDFSVFFFTSLVSVTGSYTKDEPALGHHFILEKSTGEFFIWLNKLLNRKLLTFPSCVLTTETISMSVYFDFRRMDVCSRKHNLVPRVSHLLALPRGAVR